MKVYIAFSIHGTNQFRVVEKEVVYSNSAGWLTETLGPEFQIVPSRRPSYDLTRDGFKVHWDKFLRKDGTPIVDRGWVTKRFNELLSQGWTEVQPRR
jgi:hypothetical protein